MGPAPQGPAPQGSAPQGPAPQGPVAAPPRRERLPVVGVLVFAVVLGLVTGVLMAGMTVAARYFW
ncbi:hypothetical protein SAMN02982929_05444 [Saccharopolyspora kobensis]|uniref:Uncharacterized protein n=2 Tax=Saccharopolyspora kobensis TaxID=146035 RepID=A0A1H6E171_9PSEU|nr:hypothetical protein SAMN02982929_05444 [Saccharopolyspora kobensis]SFF15131.1 hypothetical protein SAMN05216506_12080 [Saccharopolyspora kobensis]